MVSWKFWPAHRSTSIQSGGIGVSTDGTGMVVRIFCVHESVFFVVVVGSSTASEGRPCAAVHCHCGGEAGVI